MKKNARKLVAIFLACLMLAALTACSSSTSTSPASPSANGSSASPAAASAAPAKDTLNVAVSSDAGTLDPLYNMSSKGGFMSVMRTICEPLWDYNSNGERNWVLATAFDKVSDIEYTLKIREGVTFSNGNPLTADDVMFTMNLSKNDAQGFLNVKAIDFDKTKVVDDHTIDVWYTAYNASQEPGFWQMCIVDARTYKPEEMAIRPVGTGAYVVTDYVVNSYCNVVARDDYWGGAPAIKKINFKCMDEDSQRVSALETGAVDFALIPMKDIDYVNSLGTCKTQVINVGSSIVAMYNQGEGPLNSPDARKAVSFSINCQSIADIAYNGQSAVLSLPISAYSTEMQDRYLNMSDIYTDRYNVEKAKTLAEQTGLVGQTLRIVTRNVEKYITAAEIVQNGLEAIGVKSEIRKFDQASILNFLMSGTDYDIALYDPVGPGGQPCDILGMYPQFISMGWTGPIHDQYIALGQKALATADLAARQDVVYEMLKIFNEQVVWFGLVEDPLLCAYNKNLQNINITNTGMWRLQDMHF